MREHVFGRTRCDHFACFEGDEFVTDFTQQRHVVFDDDERASRPSLHVAQDGHQRFDFALGQAGGGLVEQNDRRVSGDDAGELHDATGTGREFTDGHVAPPFQSELGDEFVDAGGMAGQSPVDELAVQRLKKRRLALRDMIARLELETEPDEPA